MILDEIKASTLKRTAKAKKIQPLSKLEEKLAARKRKEAFAFEKALKNNRLSYICEIKKASPSKGVIAEEFPYKDIALEYEKAGADCISVLTEPEYFMGDILYLEEISELVDIPLLRKDFTCDEYMITEAAAYGADAILLIAAILDDRELTSYLDKADGLGLSCIFEAHNEEEVRRCLHAGARILGVNNRDLKDFTVDMGNSASLRKMVPDDIIFVAESGISSMEDVRAVKAMGADAALIGETLMRSSDKKARLRELDS